MKKIRLKIPASTSNIGPGFDTLGIALELYNELLLEPCSQRLEIEFDGGVEQTFVNHIRSMVKKTIRVFENTTGKTARGLRFTFRNDIPIARGLGSSATFRLGTLAAVNKYLGDPLEKDRILDIACKLEQHTENCVASMMGGLTASGFINGRVQYGRFELGADLTFIAVIPARPMSTAETRKILPRRIRLSEAVFNLNRTALLIHALSTGDFSQIGDLFEDKLHQQYRARILTPLFDVIGAAREAGAWGAFLSGSGSTIMAIAAQNIKKIAGAMQSELTKQSWPAEVLLLKSDKKGIIKIEE